MDTIKNYLEGMFARLPGSPEVIKAKKELYQMMEDKYNELIAEGKTENEAVGTVISEFGNLSELAEAIGIEAEVKQQEIKVQAEVEPKVVVTVDEATEYLKAKADSAFKRALGIGLIIMSIATSIIMSVLLSNNLEGLAVLAFFAVIAVGIVFIVQSNIVLNKWSHLRSNKFTLSMDATKYVIEEKDRFNKSRSIFVTVGAIMCALCWLPGALLSELVHFRFVDDLVGVMFFVIVGIGVMLLVYQAQIMEGFGYLLKTTRKETIQASYSPRKQAKMRYASTGVEAMMAVYWPTATCLYFIMSFAFVGWLWTWIIWPIAGIVHAVINKCCMVEADEADTKEAKEVKEAEEASENDSIYLKKTAEEVQ